MLFFLLNILRTSYDFFFKHSTNVSWMHLTWSKYVILFLCVVEFILWGLVCFWFACTPEWSFRGSPWKPGFLPGHLLVCGFWAPVFVPLALKTARISAWLLGLWLSLQICEGLEGKIMPNTSSLRISILCGILGSQTPAALIILWCLHMGSVLFSSQWDGWSA